MPVFPLSPTPYGPHPRHLGPRALPGVGTQVTLTWAGQGRAGFHLPTPKQPTASQMRKPRPGEAGVSWPSDPRQAMGTGAWPQMRH